MADKAVLVGVFGQRAHAERAAADLRAGGYADSELGVLGTDAGADGSEVLTRLGVGPEDAGYYRTEVAAGRCLLVIDGSRGAAGPLAAVGRNCGSFRLPPRGVGV